MFTIKDFFVIIKHCIIKCEAAILVKLKSSFIANLRRNATDDQFLCRRMPFPTNTIATVCGGHI
jgi:hypothetical protein